ncbi:J domain-containing protein [Cellulomonas sp. P5_C5]
MTHYEVLGVDPDASHHTIRAAYRRRARESHPDTGGSATEFAAVSVAWWHLGEAGRRAEYDAGLDPAAPEGWGEDVGFGAPVPRRPARPAPRDHPDVPTPVRTDPSDDVPVDRPPVPDDVPSEPSGTTSGPINPFTSPFRALPRLEDELNALRPPPPRLTFSALRWVLLLITVNLIARSAQPAGPHLVSAATDAGMLVFALWVGLGFTVRVTGAERPPPVRRLEQVLLWGGVATYAVVAVSSAGSLSRSDAVVVLVVWVIGTLLAALAEWWVARTRHCDLAFRSLTERHELATQWNTLLRTRERSGRSRFWDATQVSTRIWALRSDDGGALLGVAPRAAPQAWVDLLRSTGLDVADASTPRAARVADPAS